MAVYGCVWPGSVPVVYNFSLTVRSLCGCVWQVSLGVCGMILWLRIEGSQLIKHS